MLERIFLFVIGIAGGAAVSGATFAFVTSLKIIPRLIGKTNTAAEIELYENSVAFGGIIGNIISIMPGLMLPGGRVLLWVYGLCAGAFEGCVAVTLAEVLHVFPIIFRRLKIERGLWLMITCFALGKTVGALLYFYKFDF